MSRWRAGYSPGTVRRIASAFVLGLTLALGVGGCGLGDETSGTYYVPIQGGGTPPAPTGAETAVPTPTGGSDSPSATPSPNVPASPEWEQTCLALIEFKSTYESTFTLSPKPLERAAAKAPTEEAVKALKYLAERLTVSPEAFSYALLSPTGKQVDELLKRECGERLLLESARPRS